MSSTLAYEIDKAAQRPIAFGQALGQALGRKRNRRYRSKLNDLARDVKQALSVINPRAKDASGVSVFSQSQETVCLAQTTGQPMRREEMS
jgi:hypothetical protein